MMSKLNKISPREWARLWRRNRWRPITNSREVLLTIRHLIRVLSYLNPLSMAWGRVPPTTLDCWKWWEIPTSQCRTFISPRGPVLSIKLMSTLKDKSWERHSSWPLLMISKEELMTKSGMILLEKQMMADFHRRKFLLTSQNSSRTKSRKGMNTLSVKFSLQLSKLNLDLLPIIHLKIMWFLVNKL